MSRKRKKWLTMKVVNKKKSLPAPKKNQRCSQPITTSPPMFTLPRLICKVTHRTSQIFKEMMRMMIQKSNNRTISWVATSISSRFIRNARLKTSVRFSTYLIKTRQAL